MADVIERKASEGYVDNIPIQERVSKATDFMFPVDNKNGENGGEEVEDEGEVVDPALWLAGDFDRPEDSIGYFKMRSGQRLKLAGVTGAEDAQIRQMSSRPNPKDPKSGSRRLDIRKYSNNLVAASINKAQCGRIVGPISGDSLGSRPTGEITMVMKEVMRLSGFEEQEKESDSAEELFV